MFAARYFPNRFYAGRYYAHVGSGAGGPMVCPYVKIGRGFVTLAGEYVTLGDCVPAPAQTVTVGVPEMSGILNPSRMKGIQPGGRMKGKLD